MNHVSPLVRETVFVFGKWPLAQMTRFSAVRMKSYGLLLVVSMSNLWRVSVLASQSRKFAESK